MIDVALSAAVDGVTVVEGRAASDEDVSSVFGVDGVETRAAIDIVVTGAGQNHVAAAEPIDSAVRHVTAMSPQHRYQNRADPLASARGVLRHPAASLRSCRWS